MDYVEVLKNLVAIDTSVPPGNNYQAAMDFLEPFFRRAGFQTEKVPIPPEHCEGRTGRINLVCHQRNPGSHRLIFYSHVDVVPAEGWDAFKPWTEDGKIYGRGTADMKGSLVALLMALESLKGKPLPYDISVLVTTDEEFSQASQLRYIRRFIEPVEDASVFSLDSSFGFVSIAGLGALQMDVTVKGRSVHSGLSHLGENAVEKAALLVQALLVLKQTVVKRKSTISVHPDTGLSKMEPRLNINMIKGGLKVNIVPDECLISIDRRLIPEEHIADAERELLNTLSSVPNVDWVVSRVFRIPTVPPSDDPAVDKLAGIIKAVTGQTGKYGEMGSGDLTVIVNNEWKAKEFGLGVIRPDCNIHGKNEFAYQKDIEAAANIIAAFLQKP
ncbi:MAG: M20/M25/M40 family metallo-hydrolase [Chloroflexi bacterium]|nr:M20/M25/M40 family metallo-hydrolase [Chloroflexota bacterium]